MRLLLRLWLLLLLSWPLAANADNTADEAEVAFVLGNQAYAKRDYQRALSAYFLSYRLVPNRNVLFNIARCFEALKRYDEAYRYYYDLSRMEVSGTDRRDVLLALSRLKPKVALLEVTSQPPGAEVFVDREDLGSRGKTPMKLALRPGRHKVKLALDGHRPAEAWVQLARGKEVDQRFTLQRVLGSVEFIGSPQGAFIRETADGPILGTLPTTLPVPPGQRLFHLSAPGFIAGQVLVEVEAHQTVVAKLNLVPRPVPTGKLVVTANRPNALIKVDGKNAGFTPAVIPLPVGTHRVEVTAQALRPVAQEVTILKNEEQKLHAELRYLPPSVQAASKNLASVDEAPASITVITAEEIRAFGYQTLSEALAGVRGLYLSNDRWFDYLGVRGFLSAGDFNIRTLVLYDGHPTNDVWAAQGYVDRSLTLDLSEVERIEVVRGPGSALYGTGAFFAVINVVPRNTLSGHHVEAVGSVGALSAYRARATASVGDEGASVLATAGTYQALGAETTEVPGRGLVVGLDQERVYNASARARWGGLTLFGHLNHRTKHIPTAPYDTGLNLPGTRSEDTRGFAELRFEHSFSRGNLTLRGYYDATRYRGFWNADPLAPDEPPFLQTDSGTADWVGAEARGRLLLFGKNYLTAGLESQLQLRIDQQVFGGPGAPPLQTRSRTLLSAYLLDEWQLHPRLMLSLGLRVDKYLDLEALPLTPRLALIARPYDAGVTKVVAGTAFRAPSVYEQYYGDNNLTQRPPDRLDPETITTVELEHSHDVSEELRFTVAGYHNRLHNLIVLGFDADDDLRCGDSTPVPCAVHQNVPGLLRSFGAEAQLRWQPAPFSLVDVSYSYVQLLDTSDQVPTSTPAHLVKGRWMVPLADAAVRFTTQAVYQSPRVRPGDAPGQSVGEALLVSMGLTGELGRLRYLASVQNLLDVRYAVPVGAETGTHAIPQYGRTFLLELSGRY